MYYCHTYKQKNQNTADFELPGGKVTWDAYYSGKCLSLRIRVPGPKLNILRTKKAGVGDSWLTANTLQEDTAMLGMKVLWRVGCQ